MNYFSKSKQAYYIEILKPRYEAAGTWPEDTLPITSEQKAALQGLQEAGQLVDVVNGECISIGSTLTPEVVATWEREWRNNELARVDIAINKVQDGVGTGTESSWRAYRCALREWPESPEFPNKDQRPVVGV